MSDMQSGVIEVTRELLAAWPLPASQSDGDKENRGQVLLIAGSREMPGAAVLAATASLRAGAGKLVMAAPASVAQGIALAVPEARVIAMPETALGGFDERGVSLLAHCADVSAVLIGPGMIDSASCAAFVHASLPVFGNATTVLDALAMEVVRDGAAFAQPVVLTPHAGEMAHLENLHKDEVRQDPLRRSRAAAARWRAVVLLKGSCSCIATPDGRAWRHRAEVPGLGTSGSGDVLAGAIAGLAARGAKPEQAAAWGVALHARAGTRLAIGSGEIGYLARELPAELPWAMMTMARAVG